jgi:Holliday junction resolvase
MVCRQAAASKPVDLVCLKSGEVVLVECKYGVKGIRWAELAPLLEAAERANARPVLAIAEGEEDDRCGEMGRLQTLETTTPPSIHITI